MRPKLPTAVLRTSQTTHAAVGGQLFNFRNPPGVHLYNGESCSNNRGGLFSVTKWSEKTGQVREGGGRNALTSKLPLPCSPQKKGPIQKLWKN